MAKSVLATLLSGSSSRLPHRRGARGLARIQRAGSMAHLFACRSKPFGPPPPFSPLLSRCHTLAAAARVPFLSGGVFPVGPNFLQAPLLSWFCSNNCLARGLVACRSRCGRPLARDRRKCIGQEMTFAPQVTFLPAIRASLRLFTAPFLTDCKSNPQFNLTDDTF